MITLAETVNHPSHYNTGKIEVIDFIEDQQLGFHLGNTVKYICRAGKKNSDNMSIEQSTVTDLEKALWYLHRHITNITKVQNESNDLW